MVNTLKKLGLAATLSMAFATSAFANTYVIGTNFNEDVYVAPTAGSFEKSYTIDLTQAGTVSYSLTEIENSFLNINFLTAGLFNSSLNPVSGVLSSGIYTLFVTGKTAGVAGGSYNLNFTVAAAPVPEAQTNAMMMLGLAAIGFVVYRRKNMA